MNDHDAFMRTIIASPDDDAPRLVYADWLEEYGGQPERADFIRVQIERWKLDRFHLSCTGTKCGFAKCNTLRRREMELIETHPTDWWPDCLIGWRWITAEPLRPGEMLIRPWRRGFIELAECTWGDWLTHAIAIRAATPLRKVALADRPLYSDMWAMARKQRQAFQPGIGNDEWRKILKAEYPGIEFTLPPSFEFTHSAGQRTVVHRNVGTYNNPIWEEVPAEYFT